MDNIYKDYPADATEFSRRIDGVLRILPQSSPRSDHGQWNLQSDTMERQLVLEECHNNLRELQKLFNSGTFSADVKSTGYFDLRSWWWSIRTRARLAFCVDTSAEKHMLVLLEGIAHRLDSISSHIAGIDSIIHDLQLYVSDPEQKRSPCPDSCIEKIVSFRGRNGPFFWIGGTLHKNSIAGLEALVAPYASNTDVVKGEWYWLASGGLFTSGAVRLCFGIEYFRIAALIGCTSRPDASRARLDATGGVYYLSPDFGAGFCFTNFYSFGLSIFVYTSK